MQFFIKNTYYDYMKQRAVNKMRKLAANKMRKLAANKMKKITLRYMEFRNRHVVPIIPLHIYQAWHTDDLPNSVRTCIQNIKQTNPEFEHHLFNNHMCREFIKNNFAQEIVDTYDLIIPYAIKIDLWRYCVLYKNGGVYLDVKYSCINNFKFYYLSDKEYFCKDLDSPHSQGGIYNALIICKPNNDIMLKSINKVVENVRNKYYGKTALHPTGPLMIKQFFTNNQINNLSLRLNKLSDTLFIKYNGMPILLFNKNYRNEQNKYQKHWSKFWSERKFYLDNLQTNHLDVFTKIYETKHWGNNCNNNYSGSSGSGSEIFTQINTYVPFLVNFINENNIKTIIDLGCGDFKIGQLMYDKLDIEYIGYDAYSKIIDFHNNQDYAVNSNKYKFMHLDFYGNKEQIEGCDLCIVKDVLMHWELKKIYDFLDYLTTCNKFKYIIICNDYINSSDDSNIMDGQWRPLSAVFYPLKKYNPNILYKYNANNSNKEISLITIAN